MNTPLITLLREEKERLTKQLAAVDALIESFGEAPAPKTAKRTPSSPAGKKKPKACCGSKQQRHKKGCPKGDGKLPPDDVTWKCTECSEETTAAEKPEKCDCGAKTFIQK